MVRYGEDREIERSIRAVERGERTRGESYRGDRDKNRWIETKRTTERTDE